MREMGFQPSRADQGLWYRKSDDFDGYDCIVTHVDGILVVAKKPMDYMTKIKQSFKLRDMTDSPEEYLGNELSHQGGKIHILTNKYVGEVLRKY